MIALTPNPVDWIIAAAVAVPLLVAGVAVVVTWWEER